MSGMNGQALKWLESSRFAETVMLETAPKVWLGLCEPFGVSTKVPARFERLFEMVGEMKVVYEYRIRGHMEVSPKLRRWILANGLFPSALVIDFGEFRIRSTVDVEGNVLSCDPPESANPPEEIWLMSGGN